MQATPTETVELRILVSESGQYVAHRVIRGEGTKWLAKVEKVVDQLAWVPAFKGKIQKLQRSLGSM